MFVSIPPWRRGSRRWLMLCYKCCNHVRLPFYKLWQTTSKIKVKWIVSYVNIPHSGSIQLYWVPSIVTYYLDQNIAPFLMNTKGGQYTCIGLHTLIIQFCSTIFNYLLQFMVHLIMESQNCFLPGNSIDSPTRCIIIEVFGTLYTVYYIFLLDRGTIMSVGGQRVYTYSSR